MTALREKTFAIGLTIPDNTAFTALETLRRLGVPVGIVRRADIWTFDVEPAAEDTLAETIATVETVFNPNKHQIVERTGSRPVVGEVWIAPLDDPAASRVGGRAIPGVRGVRRRVGWQLLDDSEHIVATDVLDRATVTFLCNPAFQKAIR
jgi:hypothetical protein